MMKTVAPLGLLVALASAGPAAAFSCPAGQIYRVSLHVCQTKTASMNFAHAQAKRTAETASQTPPDNAANPAFGNVTVVPKGDDAALRRAEAAAGMLEPAPPQEDAPSPVSAYAPTEADVAPSPFGTLRPVSGSR